MATKILWLSRHDPEKEQIDELEEIFGEIEITQVKQFIKSIGHIVKLMGSKYDEAVVVLPYSLRVQMVEKGLRPIVSVRSENNEHLYFDVFLGYCARTMPLRRYHKMYKENSCAELYERITDLEKKIESLRGE